MNQLLSVIVSRGAWVAALCLFIAFVLTGWAGRRRLGAAALLYVIGTLTNLGIQAYVRFAVYAIGWGLSDGAAQPFPVMGWLLPLWMFGYGATACVLLLPNIPQHRALLLGKILHFVFLPALLLVLMAGGYREMRRFMPYDLGWLVYGLLWFRIRERYAGGGSAAA